MQNITFDGTDPDTGEVIVPKISIWRDYEKRDKVVAKVRHGDTGTLIKVDGPGCKVRVREAGKDSVSGWLTYWFIKEFREPEAGAQ
jgi:hypothetical protein